MEQMKPLMKMVFYCIDKLKRLKLSKEVRLVGTSCWLSLCSVPLNDAAGWAAGTTFGRN